MKAIIKVAIYFFISYCVVNTLNVSNERYLASMYMAMLTFATYEYLKQLQNN